MSSQAGRHGNFFIAAFAFVLSFQHLCVLFALVLNCSQKVTRCILSYFAVLSAVLFYSPYSSSFSTGVEGRDKWRNRTRRGGPRQVTGRDGAWRADTAGGRGVV